MRRRQCLFRSRTTIACWRVGDSRHFGRLETWKKIRKSATIGLATFHLPVKHDRSAFVAPQVEHQIRRRKQMFHKKQLCRVDPGGLVSTKGQATSAPFSTNTTHKVALLFDTKINVSKQRPQTAGLHWGSMTRWPTMLAYILDTLKGAILVNACRSEMNDATTASTVRYKN